MSGERVDIEQAVRALPHEHQVHMAELAVGGWRFMHKGLAWEVWGPAAPDGGRCYFRSWTLLTLIDKAYYSGYFGPKGALGA